MGGLGEGSVVRKIKALQGADRRWVVAVHFFFLRFIYLFCLYKYSVAVLRHTRRGHQIPLQMIVSHHLVAGNLI